MGDMRRKVWRPLDHFTATSYCVESVKCFQIAADSAAKSFWHPTWCVTKECSCAADIGPLHDGFVCAVRMILGCKKASA
eukprot:6476769-Amphidinium_carterae.1